MVKTVRDKKPSDYPPYGPGKRTWSTRKELVESSGFFEIEILDPEQPREIFRYQVPRESAGEAVSLAEDMHVRRFPHGLREPNIKRVTKARMVKADDEEILERFWELNPSRYLDLWELDIASDEMVEALKALDLEYYTYLAYDMEKIY